MSVKEKIKMIVAIEKRNAESIAKMRCAK